MRHLPKIPLVLFGALVVLAVLCFIADSGLLRQGVAEAKIVDGEIVPEQSAVLDENNPGIQRAMAVQEQHTRGLLAIAGVVGTATGLSEDGTPAVLIFTRGVPAAGTIPRGLQGVPTVVKVTGEFFAMKKPDGPPGQNKEPEVDRTAWFDSPVPIGVSTGNEGECSAGTIGARVKDGSDNVYALSNNHVFALENNVSEPSYILQPGLYDTECVEHSNNLLGQLSAYEPLLFGGGKNYIDAAIASPIPGERTLGNSTPLKADGVTHDGYGTPKSATVSAQLGDEVQKYGRTSGWTKGIIDAVNWTGYVNYDSGTAYFEDQIIVYSRRAFIKAGDSGSLLVTDPGRNPVGLLFAGSASGKYAIANRIDRVLNEFNVAIDGE